MRLNTSVRAAIAALPQGPSLRSGLCCPGPSSLMRPHAPHSPAHFDFTETAYTKCPRCASKSATPRRPASGSVLSLAFCIDMSSSGTTGSSFGCLYPVPSPMTLAFDQRGLWSRHFQIPHPPIPVGGSFSRLHYGLLSLQPVDLLAHLSELTRSSPSQRGLLRPGFRRIGHPLRRRI